MPHLIIEASNLENALKKAAQDLQTEPENLKYNILEEKKGFLGLNSRVKLEVYTAEDQDPGSEEKTTVFDLSSIGQADLQSSNVDGYLTVADGNVFYSNPLNAGKFPTVIAGQNVCIYLNDQEVQEETMVSEKDILKVTTVDKPPLTRVDVQVSEDKLQVFLVIKREYGERYALQDTPPTNSLLISTKVIETIEPEQLDVEQILQKVKDLQLQVPVNEQAVREAVKSTEPNLKMVVAEGVPPVDGKDDELVYAFEESQPQNTPLNPYLMNEIFSVVKGDTVAYIVPGYPGTDGTDVFGNPVAAKETAKIDIYAGEGIQLVDKGKAAVAKYPGRPVIETALDQKILRVVPLHTVQGNVDVKVGNLSFEGDVIVYGDVMDGFKVYAGGNITIKGSIFNAEIEAEGNVIIGNRAISSKILAGKSAAFYRDVIKDLEEITQLIRQISKAIEAVKKQPNYHGSAASEGKLIELIVDSKFPALPHRISQLQEAYLAHQGDRLNEHLQKLLQTLVSNFGVLGSVKVKYVNEIKNLLNNLGACRQQLQRLADVNFSVVVAYMQNCQAVATGDINILGQGCIVSEATAGGSILFKSKDAVTRGCTFSLRGEFAVNVLGSDSDSGTEVNLLAPEAVLKAGQVFPGVNVINGTRKHYFREHMQNVCVTVAEDGQLVVDCLKFNEE